MIEHRGRKFRVIRSSRKTKSLILERDGSFTLRCSKDTSNSELKVLIDRKLEWIERKMLEWEEIEANRKSTDDPLSVKYLGRQWKVHENSSIDDIRFINRRIHVPAGYIILSEEERAKMIRTFLLSRAKIIIPPVVRKSSGALNLSIPEVKIMDLGFRWGSCSNDNRVNFHWKCMTLPSIIIQYIVCHELTHLIVPDHSKRFWRILQAATPSFEDHETWLRSNGINFDLY